MKIKILAVGKLKEKAYQNRIGEYVKWINRDIPVELIFLKDNDKFKELYETAERNTKIRKKTMGKISFIDLAGNERGKDVANNDK